MNIHEDLIYTEEHEWVRVTEENLIVGITDFAQSQLGDIIFLELPDVDYKVVAGEPFGEIEAVKTVSELYAPIDGVVIEVNNDLEDFPEKVRIPSLSMKLIKKLVLGEINNIQANILG